MSALLVVAAVAAAAVPAAVATITVASLRFARWSATALDADGEPREPDPPKPPPLPPRDKDDDLPRIASKSYSLQTCPMCGMASAYAGDPRISSASPTSSIRTRRGTSG